ncbi:MAG: proprotein convertase P-domain-containing protein [Chitinophagaceae bacterium]
MRKLYVSFLALFTVLSVQTRVNAQCTPSAPQVFNNNTPVPITDNSVAVSTINVAGAPTYLYKLTLTTFIQHTFASDLDITLTSPAGTIVTITTDNGGGNDNVFNGTVWDDAANPGGQVPYTSNNGMVTDHTYSNNVLASPLVPEEAFGAFVGENPNGTWTIRVSDDLGGDVGSLDSWSLSISGLSSAPTITSFPFSNNTPVPITDNSVAISTINVAGAGTQIIDVNMLTNITHTFASDLDITITSPAGTVVTLTTDNGGGNDNVFAGTIWDDDANPGGQVPYTSNNGMVTDNQYSNNVLASPLTPEEALAAFIGENPNGTWTLRVSDDLGGDVGTLNNWSLDIATASCAPPIIVPCGGTSTNFSNNTVVPILDNTVVSSTINVAGAPAYLYKLNVITNITHTFASDLDITITSPSGTVVTLSSDNGGSNDNVFAGTTWDDDANPGGQVPYSSNNGMVTDHSYSNNVVATPLAPEEPLAAFIGENPNGTWTIRVSDDAGGDLGSLNSWSLVVGASATPPLVTTNSYSNNTAVPIPTGPAVVSSTINVAGAPTQIFNVKVLTNITHTFAADLDITIMSPAGTVVTLTTDNGAGNDNVFAGTTWDNDANPGGQVPYTTNNGMVTDHAYTNNVAVPSLTPEESLAAFFGEDPNGTWTITISDDVAGDGGSLNSWGLDISTFICAPACNGVPSPGSIAPVTSSVCAGSPVALTVSGYTVATGLTFQWKESATSGGPYTNIAGANSTTYAFNAAASRYYVCTVTCTSPGGGSATTAEVVVNVSNISHSSLTATPSTTCSPGATVIAATATGGIGNYTHTLSGPGTIGPAVVSGPNNSTVTFNVTNIPAGVHSYTLTTTDGIACNKASNVQVTVNQTPVITLTTNPPPSAGSCSQNFDGVTAPALPAGWSATVGASCANTARWATSAAAFVSAPNAAFVNDPNCISDEYLNTPAYNITSASSQLSFSRNIQLESNFDGMVLEISINGGPFTDILAAGGSFASGGYNGTISNSFGSPIAGRQAWTGNSGGFQTTLVNLPAAANGQSVVFRFRRATDSSVSNVGAYIDNVALIDPGCNAVVICNGTIVRIDASVVPTLPLTVNNNTNTHIPAGGTTTGVASLYPNNLAVSGLPTSGVTVKSVTLNGFNHTFPDDVDMVLVSPTGQAVILMSDAGGATPATGQNFILDDAAPSNLADAAFNASGTYKPTNYGAGDTWPAPGPAAPTSTTLSTFTGDPNGNWSLYVVDDAAGNTGILSTWSITFNVPQPVTFSPVAGLYADAAATIAYTGTPVYTVWAKPTASTTYTASSTIAGCTGTNSVNIQVNDAPAITSQPTALPAPICPGFNVNYSVTATGTNLTYQWQVSTDGGANYSNLANGPGYSGVTTPNLTILNVATTQNNYRYRCVVSGTCPPAATSNAVILTVATAPVIGTQPANRTVCAPDAAVFSVAVSGVPTPNIFQWQVSTTGPGGPWTNLTTGGSYTNTLTVSPTSVAQSGSLYRVIVTNSCGQSNTSNNATLTVNAPTPVVLSALPPRICISDTLVPLNATPVGGSWSGIGVSGFNFVPSATAVGSYTLTYTYVNALGCTSTGTVVAKVEDCPERIRQLDENAVVVYPNPNNGRFNIRINSVLYNYLGMRVYNTIGQLLKTQTFNNLVYGRVVPVNLGDLPSGTYMIKIFYDDGIRTSEKTFPIVIQR